VACSTLWLSSPALAGGVVVFMGSRKPRIPSYGLHKASGRAVVRIEGRDHYLGVHGSAESHREYNRLISEWTARSNAKLPRTPERRDDLIVNELLLYYRDFAKTYYVKQGTPSGEQANLDLAMRPLAKLHGSTEVREFGPLELKVVREEMIASGLARRTINQRINRIRRIFKWGVENALVPPTVLQGLQAVSPLKRGRSAAVETGPILAVPDAHVAAVVAVLPPTLSAMVRLQRLTAMRPGELVIMRGCDIDVSGEVWMYRPFRHKTEHHGIVREIPLGPQAQQIVQDQLKPDTQAFLFSPADAMAERYAARSTHRRKPNLHRKTKRRLKSRYTRMAYAKAIAYACEKASVPHWTPNQLRHAAATQIRREHGLDAAQVILGHKTARITEVYAELDKAKAIEVVRRSG